MRLPETLRADFLETKKAPRTFLARAFAPNPAFGGKLRFGALAALCVAATPFSVFGITSAFWSILAGIAASLMAERKDLFDYWHHPKS